MPDISVPYAELKQYGVALGNQHKILKSMDFDFLFGKYSRFWIAEWVILAFLYLEGYWLSLNYEEHASFIFSTLVVVSMLLVPLILVPFYWKSVVTRDYWALRCIIGKDAKPRGRKVRIMDFEDEGRQHLDKYKLESYLTSLLNMKKAP
jgi:hypothetical protein